MKHLLLFFLFSGSLDSFSQSIPVEQMAPNTVQYIHGRNGDGDTIRYNVQMSRKPNEIDAIYLHDLGLRCNCSNCQPTQPDTLRAICLVTLSPNGIAHARMGFVVIEQGKRPVYLDCRKKALKLPMAGWDFREVGVNEKQK